MGKDFPKGWVEDLFYIWERYHVLYRHIVVNSNEKS